MITNVKLIKKNLVANQTMEFHFEKPVGFEYRAGQFGDLTLIDPPETDSEGDTRGFSIVTAPFESELAFATRLRDTAFKRVIHNLPIGSQVKLDAPYGDFTLHKTETTPAVFVIGGIGVAPVRAMVAQATHDKTAHKITLLHANRSPADAPFAKDFENLAKVNPNFTYIEVATEDAPENWMGEKGRINAELLRHHIRDFAAPIYYLSGPQGMVAAMRKLLVEVGANEDNIKTEEFAGY